MDFISHLASGRFQPHGYCYQWNSRLIWLNVLSDGLIAVAYFTIPFMLLRIVKRRRDMPFHWMFVLFGVFIVACGSTHIMEVWNLWHAQYWVAGAIKAITATASVCTALLLQRIMPRAIQLPSAEQWAKLNDALEKEIAERKREERKFRGLLQSAPDATVIVDEQGEIVMANAQLERLLGYSAKELISQKVEMLLPKRFVGEHAAHRTLFFRDSRTRSMGAGLELFAKRKDESEVPVEISLSPLETETGTLVSAAIRDITEHKRTEGALRHQREKLEQLNIGLKEANKELEAFSYSVSHDLRAPLRSIDGFSLALLEDCAGNLDETGKSHLNRIRAATQRMGSLIDDLLELSRISLSQMRTQEVDVSALVAEIVADLQSCEPHREIDVRIEKGLKTSGDPGLLRVALQNLLNNAWKFTSKRKSAHVEFGLGRDDGTSCFFVRDDGAGFDPTYAARLFGAFQRLHAASEFAGTGVGLATVQRIVHRHGGRIWAKSTPGNGATFYFTLSKP